MANLERRKFGASINLGIQASEVKKDNIKSIFEVINAVKEDLEEVTQNKVSLGMRDSQKHQFVKLTALLATLNSNHPVLINPTNQVIFVFSLLDDSKTEDLTVLEFDSEGLPCTIYIDGNRFTSADIESFEDNIESLLSSPNTGEKIQRIMNIKNQENVTEAQAITFTAESNENEVIDDGRN